MELPSELWRALDLLLAAGVGGLIGIERQRRADGDSVHSAGIRTYTLVSILGFLGALGADQYSPFFLLGAALGTIALAVVGAMSDSARGDRGVTSEVGILITFILGALVYEQQRIFAIGTAVLVTLILSLKLQVHAFVGRLSEDDFFAILKFVVVVALVLPLLPAEALDDQGLFVPQHIGITIVLVLALNFASYFLAKFWDASKSIRVTALLGGLVSSTMVTWSLSARSRSETTHASELALGTLLAIMVAIPRVAFLAFVANREFAATLIPGLLVLMAAGSVPLWVLWRRKVDRRRTETQVPLGNPFELQEALRFGAFFVAVVYVVHQARELMGPQGLYVASSLAGIADLDAITLSLSSMVPSAVGANEGAAAVILAVNVNNIVKLLLALVRGSPEYRRLTLFGMSGLLLGGALVQLMMLPFS